MQQVRAFSQAYVWQSSGPVPIVVVMQFLVHLYRAGLPAGTIAHNMAALSFTAGAAGFLDPCVGFRIPRALLGWARDFPRAEDAGPLLQRCGVSYMRLSPVFAPSFEVDLFREAFLLILFGDLQISTIVIQLGVGSDKQELQLTNPEY